MKPILLLVLLCAFAGCSRESETRMVLENQPLTIDAWKELEVADKYAPETLERLKRNEPTLEIEQNWNRFMRDVVVPERRKDIPTEY